MSYQVVAILRLAHRKISADLCNDQPLDACGSRAARVFSLTEVSLLRVLVVVKKGVSKRFLIR